MATSVTKRSPNWLAQQDENDPTLNPHYRRSIKYYKKLYQAWPWWCENDPRYKQIYAECKRRRARGEKVVVDHIVPICSSIVCGLHVPWNLEIIGELPNTVKSNNWWPDCPWDHDLFGEFEPHQLRLL